MSFKFGDFFAGIGGMRFAFEAVGGECVYTSELDPAARETYFMNFPENHPDHLLNTDILQQKFPLPKFDVLVAGFPCQPYSIAGLRKGLSDVRGGDIFVELINTLKHVQPKAFLLENVAGLERHEKGATYSYMKDQLEQSGYWVGKKIMNTKDYTILPQNRPRLFIVGLHRSVSLEKYFVPSIESKQVSLPGMYELDISDRFPWPQQVSENRIISDYLETGNIPERYYYDERFGCYEELKNEMEGKPAAETLYQWRRAYVRENKDQKCPTLTANMGSGGHNVPLLKDHTGRIRKLTPKECANFQGFGSYPFKFPDGMADNKRYHQIGNSVSVPLIQRIAEKLILTMYNGNKR